MKKVIIIIILFFFWINNIFCNPVDTVLAKTIAKNYFEFLNPSRTNIEIKNIITIYYNGYPSYYIVNFIGNGYIAVSANNATIPILMYSYGGEYKETDFHNPAYLDWMENYSKEIDSVRINNVDNSISIIEWNNILNKNFNQYKSTKSVQPLITTKWGQTSNNDGGYPGYNYFCPSSSGCDDDRCNAGCGPIAMAQVMKYWMHPVHSTYQDYDWSNMPDELTNYSTITEVEAVARLIRDCGDKAGVNYCVAEWAGGCQTSLWPIEKAKNALVNDFGYSDDANVNRREWYSKKEWIKKLKKDIDNGCPVIYASLQFIDFWNGHYFIFDGYNTDDKFHINWGWNGNNQGYFDQYGVYHLTYYEIGDLTPGSNNFNFKQRAIFNLHPAWYINCNSVLLVFQIYDYISYLSHLYYNPVAGTIIAGGSETPLIIQSGLTIHYKAYNQIILNDGFTAEEGSDFTAEIIPCPNNKNNFNIYINDAYNYHNDTIKYIYHKDSIIDLITISPNPFIDYIEIKHNIENINKIEIINMQSKIVYENNYVENNIYLGFLENGIYMLKIYTKDNVYIKKIIKQ